MLLLLSEKAHRSPPASGLLLSQRSRLCWAIAVGQVKKQDGGPPLCEKFFFGDTRLQRKIDVSLLVEYIYNCDQKLWC